MNALQCNSCGASSAQIAGWCRLQLFNPTAQTHATAWVCSKCVEAQPALFALFGLAPAALPTTPEPQASAPAPQAPAAPTAPTVPRSFPNAIDLGLLDAELEANGITASEGAKRWVAAELRTQLDMGRKEPVTQVELIALVQEGEAQALVQAAVQGGSAQALTQAAFPTPAGEPVEDACATCGGPGARCRAAWERGQLCCHNCTHEPAEGFVKPGSAEWNEARATEVEELNRETEPPPEGEPTIPESDVPPPEGEAFSHDDDVLAALDAAQTETPQEK